MLKKLVLIGMVLAVSGLLVGCDSTYLSNLSASLQAKSASLQNEANQLSASIGTASPTPASCLNGDCINLVAEPDDEH